MVARQACLFAVFAALAFAAAPASGAPADLDRSFGGSGIVGLEESLPADASARLAIGPDKEIFVLYSNYAPCEPPFDCPVDLTVTRYDDNGRRDTSFGAGLGAQLQVRQFTERAAFDLAVGPDGKPVVIAFDHAGGVLTVARLDRNGVLDRAFGAGGKTTQPIQLGSDVPVAVAVQSDGKVVVAAEGNREFGGSNLLLARYLPNGELDAGFGGGGTVALTLPNQSRPAGVLLGPGGTISLASPICCLGGTPLFAEGFSVTRFLASGQPDPGWAGSGRLFFPTPTAQGEVEAAALAPDGGIFVVFEEFREFGSTPVGNVVKFRPDGTVDSGFGQAGRSRVLIDAHAAIFDGRERLIVGGGPGGAVISRLRPHGGGDRAFNGGVPVLLGNSGRVIAVSLQGKGRIVALLESCCRGSSFSIARLQGGTSHSRCLGHKATIVGTGKGNEILGTPHRDVIAALGGRDKVRGLGGPDVICGGKGEDELFGGPGRDEVKP